MDRAAWRKRPEPILPEPVQQFIAAVRANAREAWPGTKREDPDYDERTRDNENFIARLLYVEVKSHTLIEISDNHERFFDMIYQYDPLHDTWRVRWGVSDREPQDYSFEKAMNDARIMYTG